MTVVGTISLVGISSVDNKYLQIVRPFHNHCVVEPLAECTVVMPCFAHSDPLASIILVVLSLRILASFLHVLPPVLQVSAGEEFIILILLHTHQFVVCSRSLILTHKRSFPFLSYH